MTRETKIGMLVGLAFIIVIGILLSDHFRGTMEPSAANLDRAGATVRQTVNAPGSNTTLPPVAVAPVEIDPRAAVQTPRDIDPLPSPVVAMPVTQLPPTAPGQLPPSALQPNDPLASVARQNGEEIVPADGGQAAATSKSYVAQPGDSVSRMAAKFLGSSSHKNVQAIIAANPSLQEDANKVVAGQSYVIPSSTTSSTVSSATASAAGQTTAPAGGWSYTVKEGDTLWGIATGQLGTANAISAIKELNRDVLHGGNSIKPGMKLRLPSAPVAIAD